MSQYLYLLVKVRTFANLTVTNCFVTSQYLYLLVKVRTHAKAEQRYLQKLHMSQYLYLLVKVRTFVKYFLKLFLLAEVAIPIPSGEGQNGSVSVNEYLALAVAIPIPSGEGQNLLILSATS